MQFCSSARLFVVRRNLLGTFRVHEREKAKANQSEARTRLSPMGTDEADDACNSTSSTSSVTVEKEMSNSTNHGNETTAVPAVTADTDTAGTADTANTCMEETASEEVNAMGVEEHEGQDQLRHKRQALRKKQPRCYSRHDLELFNLLSQPIWVFDIDNKAMWWANTAALVLWNAESLDSLLNRDFASDMSEATERRLADYLQRFKKGEQVTEQWTFYPQGRKATIVNTQMSGLYVEDGRMVSLLEGSEVSNEQIDQTHLRGVEMLRHLPVSVCQFDINGTIMHQNPEALHVFGSPPGESAAAGEGGKRSRPGTARSSSSSSSDGSPSDEELGAGKRLRSGRTSCHFRDRFVDPEMGRRVFQEVAGKGKDYCVEAEQYTKHGPRWTSIKVRRSRDPVTELPVILYSARDITDVVHAKKEADEANAKKSEFLAVMAHEIRTPLHQLIGFIDLLSDTDLNLEQGSFVKQLQSSGQSLMAIINDLLDYTKLEAGKMELETVPFDVQGVVDGCVSAISARAEQKGLVLSTSIAAGVQVQVFGDPNRLRQILLNLLNNAVKFTNRGSIQTSVLSITKTVHDQQLHDTRKQQKQNQQHSAAFLRFEVQDSGIGIGEDHQRQIFGTFQQANASVARNYGGTGLGLAICERLAHLMGGRIGVQSQIGEGSKFWFELPFEDVSKNCESHSSSQMEVGKEYSLTGLKVLVAEDNKVNQKVVAAMLKRLGHCVSVAENGQEALDLLQTEKFDLVLMDVQMPVMDGIEATKEIRSRGLQNPIIGLTASFQRKEINYYRGVGMNTCISKPCKMNDLRVTIYETMMARNLQSMG